LLHYADVAHLWQSLVAAIVTSHLLVLPPAALVISFFNQPLLIAVELCLSSLLMCYFPGQSYLHSENHASK
jgi:hypothetical protein